VNRYRNFGRFVALSVLWGTAFVAIKAGLSSFPPILFAAIRYDVAGVLMVGYAAATVDYWRPRTRGDWTAVVVSGVLMIASYNAFLFVGEQHTTSAVAAVVVSLSPILTTAFSRALLPSERLTVLGLAGLVVGFVGVGVVARPGPGTLGTAGLAPLLVLVAVTGVALGSVLVQRVGPSLPTEAMVGWSCLFGALTLDVLSLAIPNQSLAGVTWSGRGLAAVAYLAVFASALGYLLYFDLHERLGAIEINLVSYTTPVFAALAGWLVLGEAISLPTVLGFLVIVLGFVLLKREAIREELPRIRASLRDA